MKTCSEQIGPVPGGEQNGSSRVQRPFYPEPVHPSRYQYEAFTPVKIDLGVTFCRPAATAERFKGAWAAEKPPYLTLWAQLPREKSVKIEQHTTHTTNVFGAEG